MTKNSCYMSLKFLLREVILMGFNMLEIKKDRLKEVESQIRKAYRSNHKPNRYLLNERRQMKSEIQQMEEKRN